MDSYDPICAPSRASFFTGIYPFRSGDFTFKPWFEFPVFLNSRTLMEHFRANGYHVIGSGKLMHHHRASDWDEFPYKADYGPFAYDGKDRVGHPSVPEPFRSIGPVDGSFAPLEDVPFGGKDGKGWIYGAWSKTVQHLRYASDDDRDPTPDERNAKWAADRIGQFAREQDGKPFFLAVGFIRPHTPMYAPKRYFDLFPLESLQLPVIKPGDKADTHYRDVFSDEIKGVHYYRTLGQSYPTIDDGLKAFLQAYLACVAAVDDCVGTVVEAVDNSPFKSNTIIIMTADNGWNMGQKEYLFKNSPWEESCRVPLIVRAPGAAKRGGMAEHPIGLIDIYPTLVAVILILQTAPASPTSRTHCPRAGRARSHGPASRTSPAPPAATGHTPARLSTPLQQLGGSSPADFRRHAFSHHEDTKPHRGTAYQTSS